jgi:hypothetical protein
MNQTITVEEQIRTLKKQFRLSMNGVVSQSMREKGLNYRLNFGVSLHRIKEIASEHTPSHELAQALWKEEVRECKLIAGMLQPIDSFLPEIAEIWIENIPYPEVAEVLTMSLLQRLPYAPEKMFIWMADERFNFQLCGCLLVARLLEQGIDLSPRAEDELIDQTLVMLQANAIALQRAAGVVLKRFAKQGKRQKKLIKMHLQSLLKNNEDEKLKIIIEEVLFDIDF